MSRIRACRACLQTNGKMYEFHHTELQTFYENLIGLSITELDEKPSYICFECRARLYGYHRFRIKCLCAENVLQQLLEQHKLNEAMIQSIDRRNYNLLSPLSYSPYNSLEIGNISVPDKEVKVEINIEENPMYFCEEYIEDDISPLNSEDDEPLKLLIEKKSLRKVPKCEKRDVEDDELKKGYKEGYATEIILTNDEQLEEMKKRSTSLNYVNSPYKCVLCYKGFVDKTAYLNHKEKHDKSSGEHQCGMCHMRYETEKRLRTHTVTSHSRHYACKSCSHRSHTASQAREHEKWHRGFVYDCKLCGKKFRKPTSHLTHMRTNHPSEFVCELCGDCFVGRHGLLMHKSKTHKNIVESKEVPKGPDSYCPDCDVQFYSVEAYKQHLVTSFKHVLSNNFGDSCAVCGEVISNKKMLTAHMRKHAKVARARAARHDNGLHVDVVPVISKRLSCDQCGAQFVNRSKCQAHIKRVHLGQKYNKNIVCELCGKNCTSYATLRYHQRMHTGEKPYGCTVCPKKFSDKNQLRIHNRTHTDERPYCCVVCSKTFRQKPALNRHMRVHTGVKPYECQHCKKAFSQSNSLKLHVRTVHLKLAPNRRSKASGAIEISFIGPTKQEELTEPIQLQSL